eukprot:401660_1
MKMRRSLGANILFFTFIVISSFILFSIPTKLMVQQANETILIKEIKVDNCSCLNNIFDQIFVISIPERTDTLKLTLYQLNDANINVTVWEGHSTNNRLSMYLWYKFRMAVNNTDVLYTIPKPENKLNNAYYSKFVFFLRQTQIDIIKYAKKSDLNKILILEDDILLANPYLSNNKRLVT